MAIRNFLSIFLCAILAASCSHIQTRHGPPAPWTTSTTPKSQAENALPNAPVPRTLPQIGLILGPGGMKTFAHLGVLEQFDKARIPIHAIVGIEWGALVAALYSVQGKAYDAEWRMLKLTKNDLPAPSFFSSQLQAQDITSLNHFLVNAFPEQVIDRGTIPFSCPSQAVPSNQILWHQSGPYVSALKSCMPYPPYFHAHEGAVAAAFALADAVDQLRRQGANLIIFVDVLADSDLMDESSARGNPAMALLWMAVENEIQASHSLFNEVISVPTRNFSLTDFAARRSVIKSGEAAGRAAIDAFAPKYGL